jgi:type II secretory pathway pseudopilin PulG
MGFTLVEAVISMLVFSIGILGMATLQTTAIKNNTLAETVQENTSTAMSQIEEFMASDYNLLGSDGCSPLIDNKYTICWQQSPDANIPKAKRIIVTSTFTEQGRDQFITLKIFKPFIN